MVKVLLAIAIALVAASAEAAVTLRVADRAAVSGAIVTLADVASVSGAEPGEQALIEKTVVALVPQGASGALVTSSDIREALSQAGFNVAEMNLAGATTTRVDAAAGAVEASAWAAAIEKYLAAVSPKARFHLAEVRADFTPEEGLSPVVTAASPQELSGTVRFDVADAGDLSRTAGHVYAAVSRALPVVVAAKRLPSGRILRPEDLKTEWLGAREAAGMATDAAGLVGRRVLFTVDAGKPVAKAWVENERVVKRGDQVMLEISAGRMTVSVRTTALEDAAAGDAVRLRRVGSRDEYVGEITGPQNGGAGGGDEMRRLAAVAVFCVSCATASAQVSLWSSPASAQPAAQGAQGSSGQQQVVVVSANLLRDVKARNFQVHDILSVIVTVAAQASTEEQSDLEKKDSANNFKINQYIKLLHEGGPEFQLQGVKPQDLGLDMTSNRKFQNDGSNERTDILRTRIAAEIVDIKPNGNLVIEARHTFTKQKEKTVITLTGVVRPQDVLTDNTVVSYNVADADIRYESSGPVSDASKRGWLAKIMDKVWPF